MARIRQTLVWLGFLGILCRALVPIGFMPAPLAEGGPVTFCHGGAAGELLRVLAQQRANESHHGDGHRHSGHDAPGAGEDDPAAGHAGWEHCPLGAVLAAAAIPVHFAVPVVPAVQRLERAVFTVPAGAAFVESYRARAPPLV